MKSVETYAPIGISNVQGIASFRRDTCGVDLVGVLESTSARKQPPLSCLVFQFFGRVPAAQCKDGFHRQSRVTPRDRIRGSMSKVGKLCRSSKERLCSSSAQVRPMVQEHTPQYSMG